MKDLNITKVLKTERGDTITRYEDGTTLVEKADGLKLWTDEHGKVRRGEKPDGKTFIKEEPIPLASRPLNVFSHGAEEIGRLLSNFAITPFVLDGRIYSSVEAFYAAIKYWETPEEQRRVARLVGKDAKEAGRKRSPEMIMYEGLLMKNGGPEHHELIKRAIRAKLVFHPDIASLFKLTSPRPIIHNTGRPDRPGARFPATTFARILTELRDELVEAS